MLLGAHLFKKLFGSITFMVNKSALDTLNMNFHFHLDCIF